MESEDSVPIDSAIIIVGDQNNPQLKSLAYRLDQVPDLHFQWVQGINNAAWAVQSWIEAENIRRKSRDLPEIDAVSTVDFIGHATQGKFFCGGEEQPRALSSCSEAYGLLEPLRRLVRAPNGADKNTKWGLRLIGCEVASNREKPNGHDHGAVMQFAISWYLQIPVWAAVKPIFIHKHLNVQDGRIGFELLREVSTSKAARVPRRVSERRRRRELRSELERVKGPDIFQPESSGSEFYAFDFSRAYDGDGLFVQLEETESLPIPPELTKFVWAKKLFEGRVLLTELDNGRRLAYLRAVSGTV